MIDEIESSESLYFENNSIIYIENPKFESENIIELREYFNNNHIEICQKLQSENIDFINIWRLANITEDDLDLSIDDLIYFYPYWSNIANDKLQKTFSKLLGIRKSIDKRMAYSNQLIKILLSAIWNYFKLDNNSEYGLILISNEEQFEPNKVSYESLNGVSKAKLDNHLSQIVAKFKKADDKKSEIHKNIQFIRKKFGDGITLKVSTEMLEKAQNSDNPELLNFIEDLLYFNNICKGKLKESELLVTKTDEGYEYKLINFKKTKPIDFQASQEAIYILFLLKNPSGYTFGEYKKEKLKLFNLYDYISDNNHEKKIKVINSIIESGRFTSELSFIRNSFKAAGIPPNMICLYTIENKLLGKYARSKDKSKFLIKIPTQKLKIKILKDNFDKLPKDNVQFKLNFNKNI